MSVLFLTAATVLLFAAALGATRREQAAVGITIAALAGGGAALAGALRVLLPTSIGHGSAAAVVLFAGGVGSGLLTTAAALSPRLHTASPVAASGGILLVQVLLLVEGGPGPMGSASGSAVPLNVTLLGLLTLGWVAAGAVLAISAARALVRFIASRAVRRALHAAGILLGSALCCGAVLVIAYVAPPAVVPQQPEVVRAALVATAIIGTALGLILITTRLREALRPQLLALRASFLFWRLAWLEHRLLAAAPQWAPPAGLRRPTPRAGAREALYARMVVIWDTTRALLSTTDTDVVDASLDFADQAEPGAGPARRAVLAEAGWLHLALADRAGEGPGERFTVLAHDPAGPTTDLVGEAGFQVAVARVLRRETQLLERFRRQYAGSAPRPI